MAHIVFKLVWMIDLSIGFVELLYVFLIAGSISKWCLLQEPKFAQGQTSIVVSLKFGNGHERLALSSRIDWNGEFLRWMIWVCCQPRLAPLSPCLGSSSFGRWKYERGRPTWPTEVTHSLTRDGAPHITSTRLSYRLQESSDSVLPGQ